MLIYSPHFRYDTSLDSKFQRPSVSYRNVGNIDTSSLKCTEQSSDFYRDSIENGSSKPLQVLNLHH